jgi:regulator of protease activity HflC (stomatin/prohibitin superfamily)
MFRAVFLVLAAIASLPVMNFAFGLVSAQSDISVFEGIMVITVLVCSWCWIADHNFLWVFEKGTNLVAKIRVWLLSLCVIVLAGSTVGCGRTVVEPGHVGLQIDYYGQDRGVESYPKVTGVVWYNPFSTRVVEYPTFVQTAVWSHNVNEGNPVDESISFTTADQMQVYADVSLAYHLVPERVPAFYVKFRSDDLKTFTHGYLRNQAREKFDNAAGHYRIEQIMGDNAPFLKEARTALQEELTSIGVQIDQFGFIGAPRPPEQVIEAINAKVKATQIAIQLENELRQSTAQAQKNVAEAEGQAKSAIARAQGDAEANRLLSQSITANLIEWRRLSVQQQAIQKWQGVLPNFIGGQTPIPFINVEKEK